MIDKYLASEFLDDFDYDTSVNAVGTILNNAYDRKANLRSILRKHPKWDEEQQAIIFNADFETGINKDDLYKFSTWMLNHVKFDAVDMDLDQAKANWLFNIRDIECSFATPEFAENVNRLFNINAVAGQKISRIINKVGKALKVDNIKEMKTIIRNGEEVEKDFGWNYQFAMVGDALNPIHISKYTVISINPMDYWTMSFGRGWASCHTIDKGNKRRAHHAYEGCYSGGTESYMLDNTSVVFYTVDKDCDYPEEMWRNDKDRRMMFHIDAEGNSFIFGRLYPDGRDGGETGLAAQFRQCIQKVLSECTEEPNLWKTEKGTEICRCRSNSYGAHYKDYTSYDDCGYSIRKGKYNIPEKIHIGSAGICPCCGTETTYEKDIRCERCADDFEYYCERCGSGIIEGEGYWCEDNDRIYCCLDCAEEDGCHYIEGEGLRDEDYCYLDDYDDEWYSGEPEVRTEDGHVYSSYDNAFNDGYIEDSNGEWWPEDEVFYDENYDEYFHENEDTVFTDYGNFVDEDSAREFGLIKIDGEWWPEDDTEMDEFTGEIFIPDEDTIETEFGFFMNKLNARKFGLAECCGEWIKVLEVA